MIVPLIAEPAEAPTTVPEPSSRLHRATSPGVATEIFAFALAWICAWSRATFQIRTSSIVPLKNPPGAVAEVSALPSATATVLADARGCMIGIEASRLPFR